MTRSRATRSAGANSSASATKAPAGEWRAGAGGPLPFGLLASDRDVGARCVHVDCGGGPGPQELVVDRTHATADVEDGVPVDTARGARPRPGAGGAHGGPP